MAPYRALMSAPPAVPSIDSVMIDRKMTFRLALLAVVAAVAVVLVVVLAGPDDSEDTTESRAPAASGGVPAEVAELEGVPQDGIALGAEDAPVTMVEFADLQCPFCADYQTQVFPTLLERYVKTGKLRLELRLLRFIGPDSDTLARTAAGASLQDHMWQVAGLAYARQGAENSGYADKQFLDELVADAGLGQVDTGRRAEAIVADAEGLADRTGIDSTPSFLIARTGGPLERFEPTALSPDQFVERIEQELR
jgi:protein-disulfide isomerase